MTKREKVLSLKKGAIRDSILFVTFISAVAILSIVFAPVIAKSVSEGLRLSYESIIGAVFPFMIISDAFVSFSHPESIRPLAIAFERAFKISRSAIGVFFLGLVGGFPNGARAAIRLYQSEDINKDECERLICLTSNASPSFVISGIGYLMYGSIYYGVILYLSTILSSILVGIILGRKKSYSAKRDNNEKSRYSFVQSIKNASLGTLNICGFITFFSVISGLIKAITKSEKAELIGSIFLEISTASRLLSAAEIPSYIALILTSFTVSFSGISVYMQVRSFTLECDVSLRPYLKSKLISGILSSILTALLFLIS